MHLWRLTVSLLGEGHCSGNCVMAADVSVCLDGHFSGWTNSASSQEESRVLHPSSHSSWKQIWLDYTRSHHKAGGSLLYFYYKTINTTFSFEQIWTFRKTHQEFLVEESGAYKGWKLGGRKSLTGEWVYEMQHKLSAKELKDKSWEFQVVTRSQEEGVWNTGEKNKDRCLETHGRPATLPPTRFHRVCRELKYLRKTYSPTSCSLDIPILFFKEIFKLRHIQFERSPPPACSVGRTGRGKGKGRRWSSERAGGSLEAWMCFPWGLGSSSA